ncbi:MAG: sulfur carrier protein ThiS adenylyltransferase ThiF [Syntrophales bacterium]|nr:sulfur carrier protein ThiS adenylyltransferase ThiF [Syntrophales bacterium]
MLCEHLPPRIEERIKKIKVGIAGAGGLGSNLAYLLVKTGFADLKVVDFDRVELPNLNRQYYFPQQIGMYKVDALKSNLLAINPNLQFEAVISRIDVGNALSLFEDCHIVAECLDRREEKSRFIASLLSSRKFIVSASGIGGYGDSEDVRKHRIKDYLFLVGDLKSDVAIRPPMAPKVMVAAAMMADIILSHVAHSI